MHCHQVRGRLLGEVLLDRPWVADHRGLADHAGEVECRQDGHSDH